METADSQKIGLIIKKLESLKKAKEKYWDKWPNFPLSGDPDPLGKPYWQKNVQPLITEILCDIEGIDRVCFFTHWPDFYPPLDPFEEIVSRKPDRMDEMIQRFRVVQKRVEKAEKQVKKEVARAGVTEESPTEEQWSREMSKSEMMAKLRLSGYYKFNNFATRHNIRQVGKNRQLFQIRLDKMDARDRDKLEKI